MYLKYFDFQVYCLSECSSPKSRLPVGALLEKGPSIKIKISLEAPMNQKPCIFEFLFNIPKFE